MRPNHHTKIHKKSILLLEPGAGSAADLERILKPLFSVAVCARIEDATHSLRSAHKFDVILGNLNLNEKDHALLDGLAIVRYAQFTQPMLPVIIYSTNSNLLTQPEVQKSGAFKLLDRTQPDFKKQLLNAINYAIKITNWKKKYECSKRDTDVVPGLLSQIKYVFPIEWHGYDENLYNCFFIADTHGIYNYSNSWAYICQAARNNGHKFFNGSCLITICTDTVPDSEDFQFVIINPLGQHAVKRTLELAGTLKTISQRTVLIKKISGTQEKLLLQSGKCKIHQPATNRLAEQFDDIHPQVVVNLKAFIYHLTTEKLYSFQVNLKRFSQRNYMLKTLAPELFDDFWDVVLKWKRSFIRRYEERGEFSAIPHNDDYYMNPYFPLFEYYASRTDNKNTLASLVYVDNVPVGFSLLSRVSAQCMGMYANLGDTGYEGIAEFMLYQNLTKAYWSGYKFVNLGGTESRYLYEFYKRLHVSNGVSKSWEIKSNYLVYS